MTEEVISLFAVAGANLRQKQKPLNLYLFKLRHHWEAGKTCVLSTAVDSKTKKKEVEKLRPTCLM